MAPAQSEAASPIGIANVSFSGFQTVQNRRADKRSSTASKSEVRPCSDHFGRRTNAHNKLRHKIVAKRGAAFTIMVCSARMRPHVISNSCA